MGGYLLLKLQWPVLIVIRSVLISAMEVLVLSILSQTTPCIILVVILSPTYFRFDYLYLGVLLPACAALLL